MNNVVFYNKTRDLFRRLYYQKKIPLHIEKNYITVNSDLEANNRFKDHRMIEIPWLDSVKPLKNSKILEIGCGSGLSTITLAEQGAQVTSIDVNEDYLQVAKKRCEAYGLNVTFYQINATEVYDKLVGTEFDIIVFWAVLEHMTLEERLSAMKDTFSMLPKGGLWCIIGSPNRIHFFDSHTSGLPFFHWLPDELAIKYLQNSNRKEYTNCFQKLTCSQEEMIHFYRWGRGLSFHEIELALQPISKLNIISTLDSFYSKKGIISSFLFKTITKSKFELYLREQYPLINPCFFRPYLNLIIKK